jgi:hypothetical protein
VSDWEQQQQTYQRQQQQQESYEQQRAASEQQQLPQPGQAPPSPPKKRTGLVVAIVVAALLVVCCCGTGVSTYMLGIFDAATSTTADDATPAAKIPPEVKARADEWKKVTAAFVKGDWELVEPDERQRRLAEEAIKVLLPDFTIDELWVDTGSYDSAKNWYTFDSYVMRLHLTSDPAAVTAYSFDVGTVAADEAGLTREKLDLDEGDDVVQLEGRTWVIFPTLSKAPLLRGIKDRSYATLLKQTIGQWPGGLPTQLKPQEDGTVIVHIESWDSYMWSETYDHIEATYSRDGDVWKLDTYKAVIEPKEGQPAASPI